MAVKSVSTFGVLVLLGMIVAGCASNDTEWFRRPPQWVRRPPQRNRRQLRRRTATLSLPALWKIV